MVDQLTIDHEGEAEQLDSINIPGPSDRALVAGSLGWAASGRAQCGTDCRPDTRVPGRGSVQILILMMRRLLNSVLRCLPINPQFSDRWW